MDEIPDDIWNSLFLAKGGFPDDEDCREDVAHHIRGYRQAIKNGTLHKSTRILVQQAIDAENKLRRLLEGLKKNDEYKFAGMHGKEKSTSVFAEVTDLLAKLENELKLDQARFSSLTDKSELPPLEALFATMLVIQANFSGKPIPTSSKETTTSLRFREFLKSCAQFASDGKVTSKDIERSIERVTRFHDLMRITDMDEWASIWGLPPVSRGDQS
jgi:hypothetical protein